MAATRAPAPATTGPAAREADASTRLRPLAAPRPLAEDAADVIREQILSGGFRWGEHLVEARIAAELNVSRGPVREAFKLLRAEGLVDEEPRRGTFVVTLASADVREIYDLRAALEAHAARQVATRREPAEIAELRGELARLTAAARAGNRRDVSSHDLAFHETLCRLSGNARLHSAFLGHAPALHTLLQLDEYLSGSLEVMADQHRPILAAIESGDAERAAALAARHCADAADLVAGYLDART